MTASFVPFNSENIYDRITKIQIPTVEPITDRAEIKRFLGNHETDTIVTELNKEAEMGPGSGDNLHGDNLHLVDPMVTHKTTKTRTLVNIWAKKN